MKKEILTFVQEFKDYPSIKELEKLPFLKTYKPTLGDMLGKMLTAVSAQRVSKKGLFEFDFEDSQCKFEC